ncbi:MAG: hypothetical protein IPH28_02155 [Cytophagaceae bacterium]|nr:hypothetical protein [Cytophagaceae bacterium]MBK9511945.1 hypothetical protein [Cytophagaceae bacterium]MBK9934888.1 hypothetical protein [Cytophagaceae bacterium]MBL0301326.1 hypothetical protein [Cytophagaceae bacterium]MBL0324145.1 hypothetical protein [Cytophagaceae bacterium]
MKKKPGIILLFAVVAIMTSCSYQKTNRIEQDDVNEGSEYVYGVHPDSMARQLSVTYEAKPELEARTAEIKEILYPSTNTAVAAADSASAQ